MGKEYARKEIELRGKWWLVTIHDYWMIPDKPVELVWVLWKPDTACVGWKRANPDTAPISVRKAADDFYKAFTSAPARMKQVSLF